MASNVNDKVSSSIYCQACGAANPVQATRCFACRQPLSHITGGSGAATNLLTGSLLLDTIIQQRYRILGVLNTGAVSTVYKAQDIQLGTVLDYLPLHQPPLGFDDLTLHNIWRTPDGKLYLLDIGTATPAATVSERNNSISSLGRILRQLQAGKMFVRSRPHVPLPRLRKQPRNAKHPQSSPLKVLIRQMVHKDVGKGLYTMGMVKEELQHLAAQHSPLQKRLLSRRTLLKMGGLAGLAVASSGLTWSGSGTGRAGKCRVCIMDIPIGSSRLHVPLMASTSPREAMIRPSRSGKQPLDARSLSTVGIPAV